MKWIPWSACLIALMLAPAASAHHVVSEYGIAWTEPVTVVEATVEAGGMHGDDWQLLGLAGEFAPTPWLSVSAHVHIARVFSPGHGAVFGIGDIGVSSKVALLSHAHGVYILSAGVGVEVPTGDDHVGLGGGHFELDPFVVGSVSPHEQLVVFGMVMDRYSIPSGHAHSADDGVHGAMFALHARHELYTRLGVAWLMSNRVYLGVGADAAIVLVGDAPTGPVNARAEAGFRVNQNLRVMAGADVPLAGTPRFGWVARMGAAWNFR